MLMRPARLLRSLRQALPVLLAAALLLLSATNASAQIYKCSSGNSTVYSDSPCPSGNSQTLTDIQPGNIDAGNPASADPTLERKLDMAVKAAIADNDFIRADALAITQKQRDWIAAARKEFNRDAALSRTDSDADKSASAECLQAKRNLEQAANSYAQNEILDARTSLMREACGIADAPDYVYGGGAVPVLVYPHHYHHHYRNQRPPPLIAPPPERGAPIVPEDRFITRPNGPYGPVRPLGPTN